MPERDIYPVTCHTDFVGQDTIFVAIKGFDHNGIDYITAALEKGAAVIVSDQSIPSHLSKTIRSYGAKFLKVKNARKALAELSAKASGYAHKSVKIIGITGTKGKTTTANLLFHLLYAAGKKTALLSTTGNKINDQFFKASLTTPQPDYLHRFFSQSRDAGCEWVIMEVAAQAVTLHRVVGLQFDGLIVTNIGREHLEFYGSMHAYVNAKKALVPQVKKNGTIWLNGDDVEVCSFPAQNPLYFSVCNPSNVYATSHSSQKLQLTADLWYQNESISIVCGSLLGEYNLSNIVAASAGALSANVSLKEIASALRSFPGISGRQEKIYLKNGALAIIDYAHNPLSYEAFFSTIRPLTKDLIVLFGAGGDRDAGRRPEMGALAARYADRIIVTTDNPRTEDPERIVADILKGIPKEKLGVVAMESNRKKAIEMAYALSGKNSIVALLGKGPDEYQLYADHRVHFSEKEILQSFV